MPPLGSLKMATIHLNQRADGNDIWFMGSFQNVPALDDPFWKITRDYKSLSEEIIKLCKEGAMLQFLLDGAKKKLTATLADLEQRGHTCIYQRLG